MTSLPAGVREGDRLNGGALKGVMHGATSRGAVGWYGPRSQKGDRPHRYHCPLLSPDWQIDLPPGATRDQLLAAAGHVVATGDLAGTYAEPAGW